MCLFIHHLLNVSILVWETAAPLCCYWLGRWLIQLDSPRLIYLCYVMFGWSPYINLMLYSISALHTSFYNLHQFFYLNPCTCKMLIAYWTAYEYSSSPGTYFRWSKQIQATRTSAKIFNQIENTPFSDNLLLSVFKRYKIEFIKLRQKSM